MLVYEAIKTCTISYRELDKIDGDSCPGNDFVLYPGDTIFIEDGGWILLDNSIPGFVSRPVYKKKVKLTKIYHNKIINLNGDTEWTWINDLDIIGPVIDKRYNVTGNEYYLRDVTLEWSRDEKIKELGII